ncbi:VanW family protein [Ornithinimicrobium sufpigmenti]|uniref:VanW family protein n=1 Tax=Ornithinimicrobium sufpigmenti TaxID=2508882 RepID=UPI0010361B23|nr:MULTISPECIES: VanW family protein [unclassified Ornithinimicrobium]
MSERTQRPDGRNGLREEPAAGRGWWSVLLTLAVAVVLLGGAYLAAAYYFKDRQPAGVTVAGVDIGSLTREQAEDVLSRQLAGLTSSPITVRTPAPGAQAPPADVAQVEELSLVPDEAGLRLDLDATLSGATRLSFDPRELWAHVAGTDRELPLRTAVDHETLEGAVAGLAEDFDREPEDGEVTIGPDGVESRDAVLGRGLDVAATAEEVEEAWLTPGWPTAQDREVPGHAVEVSPEVTQAEVDRFVEEELELALGAPVLVTAARGEEDDEATATAELAERDLRQLLSVRQSGGELSLELDEEALLGRVRQDLGQLEAGPVDATVRLDGTEVQVVPARVGYALEDDGVADGVLAALAEEGEGRTVEADVSVVEPAIPTEVSEGWRFSPMGSFVSAFPTGPANEARTANLRAGIGHVNGTVVMPGEQFSLGAALGEISKEAGYVDAPVIMDGRLVMGLGGGLSQISTVVLNTSWNSGVQLDAHTPHTFYIDRYPAGREATLALPYIDNLWTNDTDTPVVVRAWVSGDEIHMTYLGQRQYDVQTIDGQRRNITQGEEKEDDSEDCVPQGRSEGFTITVVRILSRDGQEVHRDEYTTTYQASDQVTCTHPEAG